MSTSERIKRFLYPVPPDLIKNHRAGDMELVEKSVRQHYHRGWRSEEKQQTDKFEKDLADHVYGRLAHDRAVFIPWLHSIRSLNGAKILEIGCGTGSSSIALAEQGADVIGIDIDDDALLVARERCLAHGVTCEFQSINAADFQFDEDFDLIIFYACIEHMTISERLKTLGHIWARMKHGSLLGIVKTPNRLWHTDKHTSGLPFFDWLPDELAFRYASKSPRLANSSEFDTLSDESMEHFRRRGRGVSFHEFELACEDAKSLNVVSSLLTAMPFQVIGRPKDWAFKFLLRKIYPDLHPGWFDAGLNLVIQR
jgi:2-polyprenyl-3-methyl-5-hydroxy-6-metoxy-1,4-benzoquinol methylase